MAGYVGFRDGGKTNEEGLAKYMRAMYTSGVPTSYSATALQVSQRGAGANMSVDIAIGDGHLLTPSGQYSFWGWFDAVANQTITAADVSNPRIDVVGVYVDLSVVSSTSNNNPGAFKTFVSTGTAAASPVANSDAAIQTALGSTTPFIKLATIAVAAGATSITTGVITDVRSAMTGRLPATSLVGTDGWVSGLPAPTSVVYNGNRSYTLTFTGDQTGKLGPGTKGRTTNSVASPTQSTLLNGTTQFWSKTAPAGMTFTNNFTTPIKFKMPAYSTVQQVLQSRYNGTSGWALIIEASGQISLYGFNAGAGNFRAVRSYQSVPINKWTSVSAQIDMLGNTGTILIDGVVVPSFMVAAGTSPTALIQAGNYEVGSWNGGLLPFNGKIAQAAVFSALISTATLQSYDSQGLAGTETSIISAYSFNGVATDLNASNANNLTASGSAGYTADAPFGGQANGTISSTLNYFITQTSTFSTNTTAVVQVPEGNTIPTSGGVASVSYSLAKAPAGMPVQAVKWRLSSILNTVNSTTSNATYGPFIANGWSLNIPLGEWIYGYKADFFNNSGAGIVFNLATSAIVGTGGSLTNITMAVRVLSNASTSYSNSIHKQHPLSLSAATPFTVYTLGAVTGAGNDGGSGLCEIFAENSYL